MTGEEYIIQKLEEAEEENSRLMKENRRLEMAVMGSWKLIDDIVDKITFYDSDYYGKCAKIEVTEINEKDTPALLNAIVSFKEIHEKAEAKTEEKE